MADLEFCRLCAVKKPRNELVLPSSEESCMKILTKLARLNLQVDFITSTLPKTVCYLCINSLESAFTFVTIVEEAQASFLQIVVEEEKGLKKESKACILRDMLTSGQTVDANENDRSNDASESCETHYSNDGETEEESKSKRNPHSTSYTHTKLHKNVCAKREPDSESESSSDEIMVTELDDQANSEYSPANLSKTWKDYTWQCSYCDTQFPNVDALRNHSMEQHSACNPYRCTDCREKKGKDDLDVFLLHVRAHRKYLHRCCFLCPATFPSVQKAIIHKNLHVFTSAYVCAGCNTSFSTVEEYNQHVKTFYKNQSQKKASKATKPKIYQCTICKKPYHSTNGLKRHLFTHSNRTRDQICKICGKAFYERRDLDLHLITHSELRPYKCEVCTFSFKSVHRLRQHVKVHFKKKDFLCNECGSCFREKKHLARHITLHTGIQPYSCPHCDKRFRSNVYLKRHLLQHTGDKPYSCDICHQQFRDRGNRMKHMKRKHGVDKSKRKRTPNGLLPLDPQTGEVIYPEEQKVLEWKKEFDKEGKRRKVTKRNDEQLTSYDEYSTSNFQGSILQL